MKATDSLVSLGGTGLCVIQGGGTAWVQMCGGTATYTLFTAWPSLSLCPGQDLTPRRN